MAWSFANDKKKAIELPKVKPENKDNFQDLLYTRQSIRNFAPGLLNLEQIAKLVFAAQGITRKDRFRTVPSAGALYPLEVYLVCGEVKDLFSGVYKYRPQEHDLLMLEKGDKRQVLSAACLGQQWIAEAQIAVIICAVYERVTNKYGQRGIQYVHIESGCAAQSLSLQVANLDLGTTVVGAFQDNKVAQVIGAEKKEVPLVVMPIGIVD